MAEAYFHYDIDPPPAELTSAVLEGGKNDFRGSRARFAVMRSYAAEKEVSTQDIGQHSSHPCPMKLKRRAIEKGQPSLSYRSWSSSELVSTGLPRRLDLHWPSRILWKWRACLVLVDAVKLGLTG